MKSLPVFIFVLLIAGRLPAADPPKPAPLLLWQFSDKKSPVVDVLPLDDETTCLLFQKEGPKFRRQGKVELETPPFPGPTNQVEFLRLFADPKKEDCFRMVVLTADGLEVWTYADRRWLMTAQIADKADRPFCHQAGDGTLWIFSWDGVIHSVAGTEMDRYDYADRPAKNKGIITHCVPLGLAEAADGTLCFFSQFGDLREGRGLDHLLFLMKDQWQKAACPKRHPGGACFAANAKLWLAAEDGLTEFSLEAEPRQVRTLALPEAIAQGIQRPYFLTRLPDGTLISLWSAARRNWYDTPQRLADGSFSRILEYDGTRWKAIPEGADQSPWEYYHPIRPQLMDKDGGLWLGAVGGGILYRSPKNGRWQRLDWRRGIPCFNPRQMRWGPPGALWVVDANGSCLAIDTRQVAAGAPPETSWQQLTLRSLLCRRKDGRLCALSDEQGGSVVIFGPGGKEFNPIPAKDRIPLDKVAALALDSQDGIWVTGEGPQARVGYYDGQSWTFFSPTATNRPPIYEQEILAKRKRPSAAAPRWSGACPIEADQRRWTVDNAGWLWVGGPDRAARTANGVNWIVIPLAGSPLAAKDVVYKVMNDTNWMTYTSTKNPPEKPPMVSAITSDGRGRWYFALAGTKPQQYAVYQAQPMAVDSGPADLGKIASPFIPLQLPWRSSRPDGELPFRYRLDAAAWSGIQTNREVKIDLDLAKGRHRLEAELFGLQDLAGATVTYEFELTYDGKTLVADCIRKLGSAAFAEREQASADLIKLGPAAVPALQAALASEDPEIVERAREILNILAPPVDPKTPKGKVRENDIDAIHLLGL